MLREQVLLEARTIITSDRQQTHGPPEDTFERIALLWEAYLGLPVTDLDVAWMMVLMKCARSQHNRLHMDNYVDAAGYCALAAELALGDSA